VRLLEDLGRGPVALDSAIFIYWIEEHSRFAPLLDPVFDAVDRGKLAAVTSALTLLEVLIVPYQAGNLALAESYESILARGRGLRMVELDRGQLRVAAQLRAAHPSLRTPDALQIGAAMAEDCAALLTNDRQLPTIPGLDVLQLSDYTS
jgi:predicted nucleic acid-binding protein